MHGTKVCRHCVDKRQKYEAKIYGFLRGTYRKKIIHGGKYDSDK